MTLDIYQLIFLFVIGCLAGFMNVMAGGGSMIAMPILVFMGMSGPMANGTNRIAIILQNLTASTGYYRQKVAEPKLSFTLGLCAVPGAMIGAYFGTKLDGAMFNYVLAGAMVFVLIYMIVSQRLKKRRLKKERAAKQSGSVSCRQGFDDQAPDGQASNDRASTNQAFNDQAFNDQASEGHSFSNQTPHAQILDVLDVLDGQEFSRKRTIIGHLLMFAVGFYGGVIQAGVGIVIMACLNGAFGMTLVRANIHKVFIIGFYNLVALAIFGLSGDIYWTAGLCLACGNSLGAIAGTRANLSGGDRVVRIILYLVIVAMAGKLILQNLL